MPEIEISKKQLSVTFFHQKAIIANLRNLFSEFWFAYCGMNHSNTLDPILILVYSLSFNHHHHSYFIIMTLLSNESITICIGLFIYRLFNCRSFPTSFTHHTTWLNHSHSWPSSWCLVLEVLKRGCPAFKTFWLSSQWIVAFDIDTCWRVLCLILICILWYKRLNCLALSI